MKNRPFVPVPVTILSVNLSLDGSAPDDDLRQFEIAVNGETVFAGQARAGEQIDFDPPLKLKLGLPSIEVTSYPYEEGYAVSGDVHLLVAIG